MKVILCCGLAVILLAADCNLPSISRTLPPIPEEPIADAYPQTSSFFDEHTANWKTLFVNGKFQLKYPPDWFVEECGLDVILIGNDQIGSGHCGDAGPPLQGDSLIDTEGFIEIKLTNYVDVARAIEDYVQDFQTATQESMTIAYTPAVKLQGITKQSWLGYGAQETIVFVSHDSRVFILKNDIQNEAHRDTFNSLLSTFKFEY